MNSYFGHNGGLSLKAMMKPVDEDPKLNLPYQPFNAWRLAPTLLIYHPGTKYIRKQKCHTLQSTNIQKIIFILKSPEKHNHSTSAGKKSYCYKTWPRYNQIYFLKSKFHKCFVLLFIWMCFIYFYTMALSTNNVFAVILVDILVTYKALHGLNGLIFYCTPQHLLRLSSSNLMFIPMTKTTLSVIPPRLCNDLPNAINPCVLIDYLKSRDRFYGGGEGGGMTFTQKTVEYIETSTWRI